VIPSVIFKKGGSPHAAYGESPGEATIRFRYSLDKTKKLS